MRNPRTRLAQYMAANTVTNHVLADLLGCSYGMVSAIVGGKKYPGRILANRIEELTKDWPKGPIQADHWDAVDPEAKRMQVRRKKAA